MKDKTYSSFLATDPQYLKQTKQAIKERPPLEEIHFEYLNQTLSSLGIDTDPYKLVSLENLKPQSLQDLVEKSFQKINSTSELTLDQQLRIDRLWDYLSESDPLEKAGLIFVFGGQGDARLLQSVNLFQQGYAPKILFTGQKAAYMPEVDITEAEYYAQKAIEAGIPEEAIILEKNAINTVQNAVNSVKLLKDINFIPSIIILINHSFQMRRSYLTFKTNADWNPKLIRLSVAAERYTKENYSRDLEGWSFVFFEYIKLYGARLMKHF